MMTEIERTAKAWQATFDAVSDPIWILSPSFTIERANEATRNLFGLSAKESIGRHCWEIVHGTSGPPANCPVQQVRATLKSQTAEMIEGERCLRVTGDPLFDSNGRYIGAIHVISDITRQRQDELRIRESEHHLTEAQRIARVGSWVWYRGSRDVLCSAEMCRVWGYPPGTRSLKRLQVMRRVHREDRSALLDAISEALTTGKRVDVTTRTVRPDGSERVVKGVLYAELDDAGNPAVLRGVGQDITEQRQTEATLRRRLAHERLLFSISEIALTMEDLNCFIEACLERIGNTLGVDRAFLRELDVEAGTVTNTFAWVAPGISRWKGKLENIPLPAYPWAAARLSRGEVFAYSDVEDIDVPEIRDIMREQGAVSVLTVPFMVNGKFFGFLGFHTCRARRTWSDEEITLLQAIGRIIAATIERRSAQDALRKSEEQYRSLAEATRDVIVTHDTAGAITYINAAGMEMTGFAREEVLGREVTAIVPEVLSFERANVESSLEEKRLLSSPHETFLMHRSGEHIPVEAIISPISPDGADDGILIVARDIRERKRAEEERELLYNQLAQARKMESVGRLAGGIAHDFNNMLAAIIGHADLMLLDIQPGDPLREDIEDIRKIADRSAELTSQLLGFARKQLIAPKVLDPNETIDGMLGMLRRLVGEHIELTWRPAPEIWRVFMDPVQINQILVNLCVNARDAIRDTGAIIIETENVVLDESYCRLHAGFSPGEYAMLAVSDDGHGIAPDAIDHVFEPFYTTKPIGEGTGMGLANVYGIVKQNHGFINVYSEPEKGTTMKIYLPRHQGTLASRSSSEVPDGPRGNGQTILVVEDDQSVLSIIAPMLERLGYQVFAASDPRQAIDIAARHRDTITLLLTDVVMPAMGGNELARRVAEHCPKVGVLFMSGYTTNAIAHRGVLDRGKHFIQKPFSMNELARKLAEICPGGPYHAATPGDGTP